jgi:hypothetical protein
MKNYSKFVLVALLLFAAGCLSPKLTSEQAANADYGPFPDNYEEIVRNYFNKSLFDPYSAHIKVEAPHKGYCKKAPIAGGGLDKFGYIVVARVNAKNKYGAYVGENAYRLLIKNGEVIKEFDPGYLGVYLSD